jgi:hypothetical protein
VGKIQSLSLLQRGIGHAVRHFPIASKAVLARTEHQCINCGLYVDTYIKDGCTPIAVSTSSLKITVYDAGGDKLLMTDCNPPRTPMA